MLLASNKQAHFSIVIPSDADPAERYAAEELQKYFDRIALAWPRIVDDTAPAPKRAVLLGRMRHEAALFPGAAKLKLGREDYVLRSRGGNLLIAGGSPRGTLYGVYDLLERIGVRWWTAEEEYVPKLARVEIDALDEVVRPPLVYRALWYRQA